MAGTFKTYVDITEHDAEDCVRAVDEEDRIPLEPRLLPGEQVLASAGNILRFAPATGRKHGTSGWLFVTNFKIAFVSSASTSPTGPSKERNKLLGPDDICLANIDQIYQVSSDRKKRLLAAGSSIVSSIKTLQIVCKDFSVHSYSFKFCTAGCHKKVLNSILHHSFPKRLELLFTFECQLPATPAVPGVRSFAAAGDWHDEIERCRAGEHWRVCHANDRFQLCDSLPQAFVVPRSLPDEQLLRAARTFQGRRPPVWCWAHPTNSCVLVRMASLDVSIADTKQESILLEHVRKSHANLREPLFLELEREMAAPAELQAGWQRLRDLCGRSDADAKHLTLLHASRWAHHVALCLRLANRVVDAVTKHQISVVLQEGEGRDHSAVVSSLAQLVMDPYYRTIHGFQSLVQKEWIALGHPFASRFGRTADTQSHQAPLFQLFLDCVWQMQHQLETSFELTETYLTSLWDSLHNSVFDTFSLDCQRQRCGGGGGGDDDVVAPPTSRSVWHWDGQLNDVDVGLFVNPLYSVTSRVASHRQRRGLSVDTRVQTSSPSTATLSLALHRATLADQMTATARPRRSSVSHLTLSRKELDEPFEFVEDGSANDSLGRSWGSRLGLAAIGGGGGSGGGGGGDVQPRRASLRNDERWKKFRSAIFNRGGTSFSPKTRISSIDEGLEGASGASTPEPTVVMYRRSWNVVAAGAGADRSASSSSADAEAAAGVFDPPTCPVKLSPAPLGSAVPNLQLSWDDDGDIAFHDLDWPVHTVLPVADTVMSYRLWSQCYLRWIPELDVRGGGPPAVYFQHCALVNDILGLESLLHRSRDDPAAAPPMQRFVALSGDANAPAGSTTLSSFHPFVQLHNDSTLTFSEWDIVASPNAKSDADHVDHADHADAESLQATPSD